MGAPRSYKRAMQQHIVYVVHGPLKYYDQARLSILTALNLMLEAQRDDLRICVYAQQPERLPERTAGGALRSAALQPCVGAATQASSQSPSRPTM